MTKEEKLARNREYNRKYRAANKDKEKCRQLRNNYGITLKEYNKILKKQEGGCAICGTTALEQALSVDHDHDTGEVRGLLCSNCNRGIGLLGDSSDTLMRAAEYLQGYGK